MLRRSKKLPSYNDGWLEVCREKPGRGTPFGAQENVRSRSELDVVCRLAFAQVSKRQQDLDFAESRSFTLSMKLKTRRVGGVDPDCKAVIDDMLFDICWVDPSRTELYLYLQEAGRLAKSAPEACDETEGGADGPR